MKLKNFTSLMIGAAILSSALIQTAVAEIRPSVLTLSPMIGAHLFSSGQNLDDAPLYGFGIGYNFTERLASEAVFSYVPTTTASGTKDNVDYVSLRLDLLYHYPLSGHFVPYLAIGAGEAFVVPEKVASDTNFIVGYGAGAKYFLNDSLALRCDLRHLLDFNDVDAQRNSTVVNNFTMSAGLSMQFGGSTTSHQATENYVSVKQPATDKAATDKAATDKAATDKAATDKTAADKTAADKVAANKTAANKTAANKTAADKAAADKAAANKTATIISDSDSDGVIDTQDMCPETPINTIVNAQGCKKHKEPIATVTEWGEPALIFYLEYVPNEFEVRSSFSDQILSMVNFVKANPGRRFVIEGHTDSVGRDIDNMKLSLLRAEKIKKYLSEKMGVSEKLLEARGFGESTPIGDNNTQEGRQQNRRVVIVAIPQ